MTESWTRTSRDLSIWIGLMSHAPKSLLHVQIVLSGFGTGEQHLKLTTIMFQNIFPAIDINTVSG